MELTPILARLQAETTGFRHIGALAELADIDSLQPVPPSCYLLPMSETAEDNGLIGGFEQRLSVGFSVLLTMRAQRGAAESLASLEALRAQLKAALLNWAPEPDVGEPVNFTGGKLLNFVGGMLWWADEFRVITYLRT